LLPTLPNSRVSPLFWSLFISLKYISASISEICLLPTKLYTLTVRHTYALFSLYNIALTPAHPPRFLSFVWTILRVKITYRSQIFSLLIWVFSLNPLKTVLTLALLPLPCLLLSFTQKWKYTSSPFLPQVILFLGVTTGFLTWLWFYIISFTIFVHSSFILCYCLMSCLS
jgi:hypothetical protein